MMAGGAKKHVPENLPKVEEKFYGKFAVTNDVAADRVSYATADDLRVPAIAYHPAGATIMKHPGLVVVSTTGGDKSSWQAIWAGILFARAGAVVLTYDQLGQYERNKERRSGTDQGTGLDPQLAERLRKLELTDIFQGVRYLAGRTDVDGKDIAVLGNTEACELDTDIKLCLPAGFLTKEAALEMNEKLKFPNWTKKQIQALPEKNKDGVIVLGKDMPEVPRDQLHAVPEAVWDSQSDSYVYETWEERRRPQ